MRSAATTASLALSPEAVAMARQLAEPDGMVAFDQHPLSNSPTHWAQRDPDGTAKPWDSADPVRQLLTYGLARVAPLTPPFVLRNGWGEKIAHPWQIVLTERGTAWLAAGASTRIPTPMSLPGRRARRLMRRAA